MQRKKMSGRMPVMISGCPFKEDGEYGKDKEQK